MGTPLLPTDGKKQTFTVSLRSDLVSVFWCERHALHQTLIEAPALGSPGTVAIFATT
jgi:hypothetical protein